MNKDEKREYNRKYHQENRDKLLEQKRQWRQDNKDQVRQYYQNNKAKILEKLLEYNRGRFSAMMRSAIKNIIQGNVKTSKYEIYLGCTCQELREYLLSQLPAGLTLDNFQACGWSVDHIVPFAAFHHINDPTHLDCEYERKLVCHYLNLQILPKTANSSKHDLYNPADVEQLKIKIAGLK